MAGSDLSPHEMREQLHLLELENAKLRKINSVLIDRVERSMDFQGNAFSLFQTAILLEERVRDRTGELEAALRELARSNRDLSKAKDEAETAEMRLLAAIDSSSEGFVLFDSDDRLVMCNSKFREFWPGLRETIHPGVNFATLAERVQSLRLIDTADQDTLTDLRRRVTRRDRAEDLYIFKLADGRWVQIRERATADGGRVAIYSNITEIKMSEKRQREREVAEKNAILGATFDNIAQGISVADSQGRLVAWNERFLQLLDLAPHMLTVGRPVPDNAVRLPSLVPPYCIEQVAPGGRVLEIQMSALPNGGRVATYTDITERKAVEWALRDSEQRIRLITDALPALIAYVDSGLHYRFTNRPYEEWSGYARGAIIGLTMPEVLGECLFSVRRAYVESALAGRQVTFEIAMPPGRGPMEYALANYVPHISGDGIVLGFIALVQDITERKKSAVQLREAKEHLERRVAERTVELTSVNDKLIQEVEERRQAEAALRVAKLDAEAANMSKTKFLAAASHDLLQPLNAARIFTEALSETRIAGKGRGYVENIGRALESVEELLTALLDISKLDSGNQVPQPVDFMLDDLMAMLVKETMPQTEARGLALRWVKSGAAVRSDPVMVRRILRNFISNAMRYTPRGRILLGCRRLPHGIAVQVWDSGIGIPDDKLTDVFQEFRRLSQDGHGTDGGIGLGLAIVERMARRLGHEIQVASILGEGSMFGVVLPWGDVHLAREAQIAASRPAILPSSGDKLANSLLMVVENDAAERQGMQALLGGWKCRVLTAAYPRQALDRVAAVEDGLPRVIIADYHLDDGLTGVQAIQTLRERWGENVPAIVLTADRSDEVRNEVLAIGGHLLNKPLKPARLRSLLTYLL